jgi:hypothetical protein
MSGPFNYIPFGDDPGQICPITSQDTYANVNKPLSVIGGGGGGGGGNVSSINVSTIFTALIESEGSTVEPNLIRMKVSEAGLLQNSLTFVGHFSTIVSIDNPSSKFSIFERTGGSLSITNSGVFSTNGMFITTNGGMNIRNIVSLSTLNFTTTSGVMTNISSINGVSWARISTLAAA